MFLLGEGLTMKTTCLQAAPDFVELLNFNYSRLSTCMLTKASCNQDDVNLHFSYFTLKEGKPYSFV
jgi:hypothetical protein